jgi:hypothetical protein
MREAFMAFDPLVVTYVMCEPATFIARARATMRELEGWKQGKAASAGSGPSIQASLLYEAAIVGLLRAAGLRRSVLDIAPAPQDEQSRYYCQECLIQYATEVRTCSECGNALRRIHGNEATAMVRASERVDARKRHRLERGSHH